MKAHLPSEELKRCLCMVQSCRKDCSIEKQVCHTWHQPFLQTRSNRSFETRASNVERL